MADRPALVAHCEPSWCDAGLGSPAVHVQVTGLDPSALASLIGSHLCAPAAPGLLRLAPPLDLETLAALLGTHGWRVWQEGEVLRASPPE